MLLLPLQTQFVPTGQLGTESARVVLAQDPGTRIEGEDLEPHVPVYINGTSDFESQGWPGSGTEGDPYIISELNITYDVGVPNIRIYNTNAYFIIEDCFIGQQSNEVAIHLENITHGTINHITVDSEGVGVRCKYTDATTISNSLIMSSNTNNYAIEIDQSNNVTLTTSTFDSTNWRCAWINGSHYVSTSGNTFSSVNHKYTIYLTNSNDFHSAGDSTLQGHTAFRLEKSNNTIISEATATGRFGINIYDSKNVNISDSSITSTHSETIRTTNCDYVRIMQSLVTAPQSTAVYMQHSNHSLLSGVSVEAADEIGIHWLYVHDSSIEDTFVNDTGSHGIYLDRCDTCTVANTLAQNIDGHGIYYDESNHGHIMGSTTEDIGQSGIRGSESNHLIVEGAEITGTGDYGIEMTLATNITLVDNVIENTDNSAIMMMSSPNATIVRNVGYNGGFRGIDLDSSSDCQLMNNSLTGYEDQAIYATNSHTIDVTGNEVYNSDYGVHLDSSENVTGEQNEVADCRIGIRLHNCSMPHITDSVINYCDTGMYIEDTTEGSFSSNNFTDCSIVFPQEQNIAQLNHSFADSWVNQKPLFYALNQSALDLDGGNYGEIILVNCSDSTIDGGEFTRSTSSIQVHHSDRIDISNIHVVNQLLPVSIYQAVNLSIVDSVFEGRSDNGTIVANNADGFTADNVTLINLNQRGIQILSSNPFSVKNSHFQDIADAAISTFAAQNGLIEGNQMVNTTKGAELILTIDTVIHDNHIMWSTYGVYAVYWSDNNNVTFNNVHDNEYAIRMEDCWSWHIYNNSVRWNSYGLYITNTNDDQWIYNNTFALNTIHNGYDTGDDDWDDRVDGGNYWGDYSGSGVYNIPGGISMDRWPFKYIVTEPEINNPKDIWYAEGSEGNKITWLPFDNNLRDWTVEIDGSIWASDAWNYNNITVNVDGLEYGVHTANIMVRDLDGNNVTDTVMIHVYDDTLPQIDHIPDRIAFVDGTDQMLSWEVSDLNPATYQVYVDDTEFEDGSWTSGTLEVGIDGFEAGTYEFRIVIEDVDGNEASDTVVVKFIDDNQAPTIDSPADIMYVVDTTGNSIVWTPSDEYPDHYVIMSNETEVKGGKWGGSRITLNVDDLEVGTHTFTLTVYDGSGLSASDSVNVTVLPTQPTTPEQPLDYMTLLIIGAGIGGTVLVIAGVLYYRREKQ